MLHSKTLEIRVQTDGSLCGQNCHHRSWACDEWYCGVFCRSMIETNANEEQSARCFECLATFKDQGDENSPAINGPKITGTLLQPVPAF